VYYENYFKAHRKRYGAGTWENEVGMRQTVLSAAILSGNEGAIGAAARACLSIDGEYPLKYHNMANHYWCIQTASHIILGDDGRAKALAKCVNRGMFESLDDCRHYDGRERHFNCLIKVTGNKNIIALIRAINVAINKVFVLDKLESTLSYYRAREYEPGQAEKAYKKGIQLVFEARTKKELREAKITAIEEIKKTPIDTNRDILHVDLTGEIFMVLDSFSNQNLERELGRLGVQTRRSLTLGGWIKTAIIPKMFRKEETHLERAYKFAKPYLSRDIGGDALESVGDVAYATETGVDGIIHVSPFTCMPEIMSQNIFPLMRKDGAIPVLALVLDEQTGRAGYITRLEAFVDLMRRRKRQLQAV
jgi:hypothetical protein